MDETVESWEMPRSEPGLGRFAECDSCLTIDEVLQFVQGQLDDIALHRMHEHVDRCELCQRLVNEGVHALDSHPLAESIPPCWNTVFQPNTTVGGRYRILRLVARGGMGEVYEAHDTALQERLAIKTVTSTACDSLRALECLKAEVHLTRRISHPNVCRIYDFGTHSDSTTGSATHFLAMEYVEGECLGKKLRSAGALPLAQSLSIARQLLLGLRAAHAAGVLHRDLKSDNVMLRKDVRGGLVPVILDFGLAKALNDSGRAISTLVQDRGMIGTVGYMAPEQVEGHPLTVTSDLYAFGVVWFEMLTGELPFSGDSAAAAAIARLHRAAVPPSSLNPAVPKWLDKIVLRCLNRHAERRFESAQAVLDALRTAATMQSEARKRDARWLTLPLAAGAAALALLPLPSPTPRRAEAMPVLTTTLGSSTQARLRLVLPARVPFLLQTSSTSRMTPHRTRPGSGSPAKPKLSLSLATVAPTKRDAPPPGDPPASPTKKPRWLPIWSSSAAMTTSHSE